MQKHRISSGGWRAKGTSMLSNIGKFHRFSAPNGEEVWIKEDDMSREQRFALSAKERGQRQRRNNKAKNDHVDLTIKKLEGERKRLYKLLATLVKQNEELQKLLEGRH